jgi:hypothetical protein
MAVLIDALIVFCLACATALGVLYIYLADRMVSGR